MSDYEKVRSALEMIRADAQSDAEGIDGAALDGRVLGPHLGQIYASIHALAGILLELTKDSEADDGEHPPYVLNPEAVGDPDQTPVVQVPPWVAAVLERTRCAACGLINHVHERDCPEGGEAP